ncbi:hypothetical protein [Erythrobacter sp. WG]|uniref:hypothetical protein n=1 Tax=Erythrobacter sp. WG TaxID=2985510 RepID=UPI00226F4637|nr:hypothetical protein [Erythrobacter sp. WG]MCX9146460.1 hypothetical protein [Erythrobacter sp. WG]
MLSAAISLVFTVAGVLAVAVIALSLRAARAGWEQLLREGEVLRAGLALQAPAPARAMGLRPAVVPFPQPRRTFATRRPAGPMPLSLPLPLRACAAA